MSWSPGLRHILPAVSIPPFLDLPKGVTTRKITTARGAFASLDNEAAVQTGQSGHDGTALFIPGFTGSKEDFIAVLGPLARRGRRAVALDLQGQYESAGPTEQDAYSIGGFAADVLTLARELPRPLHLVGHSLGGLVAREVVLADPLLVETLTLLSSGPAAIPSAHQPRMQLFAQVLAQHGLEVVWAAKQALEEEEGTTRPTDPAIAQFVSERFLASSAGSLLAMVDILCSEPDRLDELSAVAPRTLVMFGQADDVWSPEEQRQMAKTLACELKELPGIGHSPAAEAPEETAAALEAFWSGAGT